MAAGTLLHTTGLPPQATTDAEMNIIRWNPWTELDALQAELNRNARRSQTAATNAANAASTSTFLPATDIQESESAYEIAVDLPGVKLEDVRIELMGETLEIAGRRIRDGEPRAEGFTRTERRFGAFSRSFRLGKLVNEESIKAKMEGGVLTVTLPKRAGAQPRRIEILA